MMKVTLRKARKIEQTIGKAIKAISIKSNASISLYEQNVTDAYLTASMEASAAIEKLEFLIQARKDIRNRVAEVNRISGIDTVVADRNALSVLSDTLGAMVGGITEYAPESVERYHTAKYENKANEEVSRNRWDTTKTDNVTIPLYTQEDAETLAVKVRSITKQINDLDDKLFDMNASNYIDIDESATGRLEEYGVL